MKKSQEFTAQHKGSKEMKDTSGKNKHLAEHVSEDESARKKPRFDHIHLDIDTESILSREKLNDLHITLAQQLLKQRVTFGTRLGFSSIVNGQLGMHGLLSVIRSSGVSAVQGFLVY